MARRIFVINNIKLSPLISDGMVLQRNAEVKIWGKAIPNESVTLNFKDKIYNVKSDKDGCWEVVLNDLSPGGPYKMIINCGTEKKEINDIMVGDVWLLGGQSNMELPILRTLDLYEDEVKNLKTQIFVILSYLFHITFMDLKMT